MQLPQLLEAELQQRVQAGTAGPGSLTLTDASGNQLELTYASLDSMSCALEELRLSIPGLANQPFQVIEDWAKALSRKITYLLEQIGPLEFDPQEGEAMIRSTQPSKLPQGTVYYEFLLKSASGNSVTLKRYEAKAGQPGRQSVTMQLTHEVLVRLVQDMLDTLPAIP